MGGAIRDDIIIMSVLFEFTLSCARLRAVFVLNELANQSCQNEMDAMAFYGIFCSFIER